MTDGQPTANWFDTGGGDYARFRPEYPPTLARALAAQAPGANLAVDVGCGTGQLTTQLADLFARTIGADPSADQIAHAAPHPRVEYVVASAEKLPIADSTVDLITAAQAAHWFDLPAFYDEAGRIAAPGAILALISYGVLSLDPDLQPRFARFYSDEIGPYWPAERRLVDDGYRTIPFPFPEIAVEPLAIRKSLTLPDFLGYVSTWSAVRAVTRAERSDILTDFAHDLTDAWGDPARRRPVEWPINARVGVL